MKVSEHFDSSELNCHHCGAAGVKPELVAELERLRGIIGKPIKVSSAYRCKNHPIEAKKKTIGQHVRGVAADISVTGLSLQELYNVIAACPEVHGIGVSVQHGYVHFDLRAGARAHWKYKGDKTLPWNGNWEALDVPNSLRPA